MSASIEEIAETAINRIVLKCHVKPPTSNHSALATSKIGQKERLTADRLISRGNSEYSRGGYETALKEYESSLAIFSRVRSKQYYSVLGKMGDCQRRMRNIPAARRLYEESSLVYTGSF